MIWVIDRSSILTAKAYTAKYVIKLEEIYKGFSTLVKQGELVYPQEVIEEFKSKPNLAYKWVQENRKEATRFGTNYDTLKEILSNDYLRLVHDSNKTREEADPYLLSLAQDIKNEGNDVGLITEEIQDRLPSHISLNSACGYLEIPCLRVESFMIKMKIVKLPPNI